MKHAMRFRTIIVLMLLLFSVVGGTLVQAQDMPVAKIGVMVLLAGAFGADARLYR